MFLVMNGSKLKTKLPEKKVRRKESVIPFLSTKIPAELTEEQVAEIQNSFNLIDANQDGRISKKELQSAAFILGMNPTDGEIDRWLSTADVNGDGFISFDEYLRVMKANYVTIDIEKERMKTAFALLDRNGDGVISLEEFRVALMYKNDDEISKEEVEEFFREVDSDGDGVINYKEFVESQLCSKVFA